MNKLLDVSYTIGFVGKCGRNFCDLTKTFSDQENNFVRFISLRELNEAPEGITQKIASLFVDVDDLGGILDIINDLLAVRRVLPRLPVVLISSEFSRNEFDLNRGEIFDYSLKTPLSSDPVEYSALPSRINNLVYETALLHKSGE